MIQSINLLLSSFKQCYKVCVEFSIETSPQRYQNKTKLKDAVCFCKEKMIVSHVIQFSTYAVLFASRMVVCWTCSFIFTKSFDR